MIDNKHISTVFLAVKTALVLLLLFVIVRTVMMPRRLRNILKPTSAFDTKSEAESGLHEQLEDPQKDYSSIVERNIFGAERQLHDFTSSENGTTNNIRPLAQQTLGLTLLGTVCGNREVARAIIKNTKTNDINLYRTGDTVAAAYIELIERDAVVLRLNGKRRLLRLNTQHNMQNNSDVESSQSNEGKERTEQLDNNIQAQQSEATLKTIVNQIEVLLERASIEPYTVNDKVEGLKITGLENVPLAESIGLKDGDIIRVVNGQQLTSRQKAFQIFKKVRSQPTMDIELMRKDRIKRLSFGLH